MAVVSVRIEDKTKNEAEEIADSIGLTLSSVVGIFLKRFVAEQGFPFPVIAKKTENNTVDIVELTKLLNQTIANNVNQPFDLQSIYPDNDGNLKQTK